MGYKAEKEHIEQKLKRIKYIILSVVLLLVAALGIFSAFVPAATWKYYFSYPTVTQWREGELRVHYIDVGQGDCALIQFPDGQTLLMDGGNTSEESENALMRYLNALKIKKIDCVMVTHSDGDHCGGIDKVLLYKEVGVLYLPDLTDVHTNTAYAQMYDAAVKRGVTMSLNQRGVQISSKNDAYNYQFVLLYPYVLSEANGLTENDGSLIAWLDYNGVSTLFTGDSSMIEESMLMVEASQGFFDIFGVNLTSVEILKVAHHGSRYATSEEFLQYLNVKSAIISCGEDNPYGHPHAETLTRLQKNVESIYRTDELGNIVVTIRLDGTYSIE